MEAIEQELEQKSIERIVEEVKEEPEPEPEKPKPKTKRQRSQKQIEAFEKAKAKRAENLRLKKEQKEKEKAEKKTKIKEFKKELDSPKKEPKQELSPIDEVKLNSVKVQQPREIPQPVNPREQVIQNHYYYYGVPPQEHYSKPKKKKRTKRPPTPSSSESESESESEEEYIQPKSPPVEPESYKELQTIPKPTPQRRVQPKQQLKFGFA